MRRRRFGRRMLMRELFFRRFLFGTATILVLGGILNKIHNDDIKRIEEHTKKKPENLTESELAESMKKLGIKKLEITADEKSEIQKTE